MGRVKKWVTLVVVLAACQPAECRFSRSGPFRRGSLKIHVAQESPAPGLQSIQSPDASGVLYMNPAPELTEADLSRICVGKRPYESHTLFLSFNAEGSGRLAHATKSNVGKRLVFMIDGRVITAPVIHQEITGGDAVLESGFTDQEAEQLARVLSGS